MGEAELKIVLHYEVGPEFASRLIRLGDSGLEIVVCPVAEREKFAREMIDAEFVCVTCRGPTVGRLPKQAWR